MPKTMKKGIFYPVLRWRPWPRKANVLHDMREWWCSFRRSPGDTVDIELTKIKSAFLEGRTTAITAYSPDRAVPFCKHFGLCGGCSWQHIKYEVQLQYKQQQVIDNLERLGGLTLPLCVRFSVQHGNNTIATNWTSTFTANRWLTKEEMGEGSTGTPGLGYHPPACTTGYLMYMNVTSSPTHRTGYDSR